MMSSQRVDMGRSRYPRYDSRVTSPAPDSTPFDYAARMQRARDVMSTHGLDGLLLSVGTDLPYLTGYEAMPLERLTMLVLTASEAVLVVPELEAPRVSPGPFTVKPWGETEDPVAVVAGIVSKRGRNFGIGDHTWSLFLLRLQEAMEGAHFSSATPAMTELRIRKETAEIDLLRRAAQATDRVAARLAGVEMEGMSERQLARLVSAWTVEEGHHVSTFNIVASGPNGASPHHEPGERSIAAGDLVVIDFGGRLQGYCSDTTRTFAVGEPDPDQVRVHEVVQRAQREAVEAVRPGVVAADIDRTARDVIEDAGFGGYFIHRTGHGIGLEAHEEPYIVEGNRRTVEPGMAFSIEPGIYLPGRFGVRLEDIVVVTSNGVEALNRSDHGLIQVA